MKIGNDFHVMDNLTKEGVTHSEESQEKKLGNHSPNGHRDIFINENYSSQTNKPSWKKEMSQTFQRIFALKKKKTQEDRSVDIKARNIKDLVGFEMQVMKSIKPEGLDELCKKTKFSRKELQLIYRGFKQECPTGIVNEDTFVHIYSQFFPLGDSTAYARFVFKSFDGSNSGTMNFEEFVDGLSVLSRGTTEQKLMWVFNLYDVNGDGVISRDEMLDIVSAIYDMMGRFVEPVIDEYTVAEHVEMIFNKLDTNKNGVITLDEFLGKCSQDEAVLKSMCMFDTVL